jgi:hypothetical protein
VSLPPKAAEERGELLGHGERVDRRKPEPQRFGPMNSSSRATDPRLATEMFRAFITRHSMPRRSQVSQKSLRMSAEALEKL